MESGQESSRSLSDGEFPDLLRLIQIQFVSCVRDSTRS